MLQPNPLYTNARETTSEKVARNCSHDGMIPLPAAALPPTPNLLLHHSPTPREIQQLHAQAIKLGHFHNNPSLTNKLISTLSSPPTSLSDVHYALSLLNHTTKPSPFLYNTLIRSLNHLNHPYQALLLFHQMLQECIPADKYTYPFLLKSCAQLPSLQHGEQIHCMVIKTGYISDIFVANSLIHVYSKCGRIESACKVFDEMSDRNVVSWNCMIDGFVKVGDMEAARRVFDEMPERNIVSWNSMIAGCVKEGLFDEVFELFGELQRLGVYPDEATLMSVISVVSDLGLLSLGRRIHGYVVRNEFGVDGGLGVAIIDMYSKCGSVSSAVRVFENVGSKNVGHWTSMIVGLAVNGYSDAALKMFTRMQRSGVKPNYVTFIGVLSACSHGGLVEEGIRHFNLMRDYNIEPIIQHYGCLVDLLGRCNYIKEAKLLIDSMPLEPSAVIWGTLLAACRNHGDIEIGEIAAHKLIELTPDYGGGYVLLSNLYADSSRWMEFGRMRRMMGERGVEKVSGLSWIELDGEIHEFLVGDKFHPRAIEIYELLDVLQSKLRWENV